MITSKPAIGAEGQDMKLSYRLGGSSVKLFFILLYRHSDPPRPAGGQRVFWFLPSKEGFVWFW